MPFNCASAETWQVSGRERTDGAHDHRGTIHRRDMYRSTASFNPNPRNLAGDHCEMPHVSWAFLLGRVRKSHPLRVY